jgi:V8-like Glu-specific endopeptidase
MRTAVAGVIEYAEKRDRFPELLVGARAVNPTNLDLLTVATTLGVSPSSTDVQQPGGRTLNETRLELERIVDVERGIKDLGKFSSRIQEYVQRVCAIEIGQEAGTGFLIGPRTVLTNYHVVEEVIKGHFPAGKVVLRFDYHRDRDGVVRHGGTTAGLAQDWCVHAAPYSNFDTTQYAEGTTPPAEALDYAVLKLTTPIGSDQIAPVEGAPLRGWVEPRAAAYDFPTDSYLMVVQHPCKDPISYDSSTAAVIRVVGDSLRVHYRVNTLPGSSGSPVLNRDLELVALHHAGEAGSPDRWLPCNQQLTPAAYNQGIPIATIQKDLDAHELGWVFGQDQP